MTPGEWCLVIPASSLSPERRESHFFREQTHHAPALYMTAVCGLHAPHRRRMRPGEAAVRCGECEAAATR